MSQSTNTEEWRRSARWWKWENGDRGKKNTSLHLKVRSLDRTPLSLRHTNDQQGCMILTQSLRTVFVLSCPLFSVQSSSVMTLQRNKKPSTKTCSCGPEPKLRDDLNCDLRRIHEEKLEQWPAAVKAKGTPGLKVYRVCTWADCVTITITFIDLVHAFWHSYWALKGVFHVIFFHSQFTVLALERMTNALWSFASCSMCILWLKRLLTILKGLCNASIGVCNALYNWILHKTPHSQGWKWICTISEFTYSYYILIKLPVKRTLVNAAACLTSCHIL